MSDVQVRHTGGPTLFCLLALAVAFLTLPFRAHSQSAGSVLHTTIDQRTIRLSYVGGTIQGTISGSQFTVNIIGPAPLGATAVSTTCGSCGVSLSPTGPFTASLAIGATAVLYVRFSSAGLHGHSGIEHWIKPGETMNIAFTNTGNTVLKADNVTPAPAWGPTASTNNYTAISANGTTDILFSLQGVATGSGGILDQCSPVNTNYYTWTYLYSLRLANSTSFSITNNKLHVTWGNSTDATDISGYYSNSGGDPMSTGSTTTVGTFTGGNPGAFVSFRPGLDTSTPSSLVFNDALYGYIYPDNLGKCNFASVAYPTSSTGFTYNGSSTTLQVAAQFNSYDYDDQNTGSLVMNPTVTNTDKVCLGNNVNMTFTDASVFNCIGNGTVLPTPGQGAATTPINTSQRWIRFVYGGFDSPTPQGNIRDVYVGGTQVTNTTTGVLLPAWSANPLLPGSYTDMTPNGSPMSKGYVKVGAGGVNIPDANGVIQLSSGATASNFLSSVITTTTTANHAVGQRFYVTLQYWGVCNPYPSSAPVEISVDYVEIVTIPAAPVATTQTPVCNGTTPSAFGITTTGIADGSVVNWYASAVAASPFATGTLTGNASSLAVTSAPTWVNATTAAVHTVYASYFSTPGGINCESPRTPVIRTVREDLNLTNAGLTPSASPGTVCAGTTGVVFTVKNGGGTATAPPTQPIGGTTEYFWTVPAGWTITSANPSSTATLTVDIGAGATSGNATVVWRYTSASVCTSPSRNAALTVNPLPTVTTANTATICSHTATSISLTSSISPATFTWTLGTVQAQITGASAGSGATIAQTLQNSDNAATHTAQYIVTPTVTATGCVGAPYTITVSVLPRPTVNNQTPATICSDANVSANFNGSSSGVATNSYNVSSVSLPAGLTLGSGHPAYPSVGQTQGSLSNDQFTNTTGGALSATYTVVPVTSVANGSCQGASFTVIVPVNPEPTVSNQTVTVCSRSTLGVNFNGSTNGVGIASYTIVSATVTSGAAAPFAGSPTSTGAGFAASAPFDDAWQNVGAVDAVITYTVTPIATTGSCAGNNFTLTATIRPEPVRSALANPFITVCSDVATATNFPASSSGAATSTYNITGLALGAATVSGGGASMGTGFVAADLADDAFNNVTGANVDVVYTIVPVSANACQGASYTLVVRVNPEPVVGNQTPAAICSDAAYGANFPGSSNGVAISTYNISTLTNPSMTPGATIPSIPANGLAVTAIADDFFTNISGVQQNATYTVVPVATTGSCQGNSFTITIPVNSGPSVANQDRTGTPICSRSTVGVNFNASGNAIAANTYEIVAMNIGALVAGAGVSAVGTTGLANTALSDDSFTNTTSGTIDAIYTVRPRGANGCAGPNFTVTIRVRPEPVVANQTPTTCSDVAVGVNFGNSSSIAAATYNVTAFNAGGLIIAGGAPGIAAGLANTALADDVYTNLTSLPVNVSYTVVPVASVANGSCQGQPFTVTLTVNPEPVGANTSAPPICSGASVGYNLQTQNINTLGNSVNTDFTWQAAANGSVSGESTSSTAGDIITDVLVNVSGADQTVVYTVTPTSTLACVGTNFTVSVIVRGPTVVIGGAATQSVCSGSNLPLTAVETYTSGSFTARKWTGTFDPAGPAPLVTLTDPQLTNILGGTLTSLNPTFNSNGDAVSSGLTGQFVLTLTSTDNNTPACTANDVLTINVSQIAANILHGPTAGTVTNPVLTETVCNSTNVFLNGNPTGGSGVYTTHAWTVASSTPIVVAIGSVMTAGAAASQTPTFNYTNATNAPVTIVLRYSVTDNAGCSFTTSAATDISITVNPTPTVDAVGNQTLCAGANTTAVTFASAFNVAGTTFPWTNTNTAIGLAASGPGNIPVFATTNTTNVPISGTITVTPTANSCTGTPGTFTINVNPKPVLFPYTASTMCSGSTFTVTPTNGSPAATTIVPANTFFTWGAPTISPGTAADITGEGAGGGAGVFSISQTLTNLTNVSQTLVYTVTPTSGAAGSCVGSNFTVTVTVDPMPHVDNRSTNVCSGTVFNVAPVNAINSTGAADPTIIVPANIRYAWGIPAITPGTGADITGEGAAANQTSISQTLTNLTNVPQTLTYTVTPSANTGLLCTGSTFTVTVRLDPRPFIDTRTQTICSQATFTIAPVNGVDNGGAPSSAVIVPGGTTYTWTVTSVLPGGAAAINGESNQAVAQPNISQTLDNQTNVTQTVTYSVAAVSGASGACPASANFTTTITVSPKPVIGAQVLSSICSGTAFSLTPANAQPVTIVPAGTTYTWTVVSITPTAGSVNATAQPVPQLSIGQTLTNTTNLTQTVRYSVTPVAGSCTGTAFNVDVPVLPRPAIPNQTAAVCSGSSFLVSPTNGNPTPATIVPAGTTYSWPAPLVTGGMTGGSAQAAQASISQTLTNSTPNPQTATYTVTPTAGGCAGSTFQVVATINPIPQLNSTLSPTAICSGTFTYTPTSLTAGATFDWTRAFVAGINESASAGSGPISETLTNPTTSPVDVTYEFTISANSCSNIQNVVVRVNPTPVANNILGPSTTCVSPTIDFFYQVTQNAGSTYSWDIPSNFTRTAAGNGATPGGGPGAFGPDYFVLLKFTTATVQNLIVYEKSADGCVSAANILPITVSSSPPVGAITGPTSVCKNKTGQTYSVPPNANSTFVWEITTGDAHIVGPSAGTNLFQIIVDFGVLPSQVKVTETNLAGCPATYPIVTVSMIDAPVFAGPFTGTICSGTQASSVINLTTQVSVPSTFTWFVKSITPNISGAVVNEIGSGPLSHAIPLTNISGSNGTIVYTVTPTATAAPNCMGLATDYSITIKPEPVVAAILDQSVCPNILVNGGVSFPFTSNVGGATISWTNSNAAIGIAAPGGTGNIIFTSAENLTGADIVSTVNVTAAAAGCTSAGANAKSFNITLKPRPVVTALPNISVCPGDAISVAAFTSNTIGGETYAWTNDNAAIGLALSGTGNIAGYFAPANNTGADVVGTINTIGTRNSCAGPAMTFTITIKPQPVVANVIDKQYCPGDAISIPLSSNVAGATLNWSNSNTSTGLAASGAGTIVGTAAVNNTGADIIGTVTVIGSANGCSSTGANIETFTVTIKPTPIVDPVTNIIVCSGANVPLTVFGSNILAGGVTFNWTNDNTAINLAGSGTGNIASFTAGVNITGLPIVANISVTGTKNGCAGPPTNYTITVNPEPVVDPIVNVSACPGDVINIPLTSNVAGATISWTNTNTSIGLAVSGTGSLSYTAPANNTGANVSGTIAVSASLNGCTSAGANSKSFIITIKPTPITNTVTNVAVCSGAPVAAINFAANTGGGETFAWTNDNAAIGLALSGIGSIGAYTAPVNISGAPIVANLTVTATKNSCAGPPVNFTITINPEPVVAAVGNGSFCTSEAISIPLSSNVAGSTISWTNSNTLIGLAATGTGNISYIAPTNNTGADIVGTLVVTASRNGCTSAGANSKTFTITIKPTPIVNVVTNVTVCSGTAVPLIAFGSNIGLGGVTFNWTNDNTSINLAASGVGDIASFTAATNTTSSSMVANISVTGTKNSCAGPARTFTITVLPEPVGTPTLKTVCSDEAVATNLSTLITGGAAASTYNITITNLSGLVASAGSPVNGTGFSATEIQNDKWTNLSGSPHNIVYSIVPVSGGSPACAGASFDLTVTVNPEPVVAAVSNQSFCPAASINIPLTSNVVGATLNWTNSNPAIGLGFSGSGDIIYTAPANNTGANIVGTITVSGTSNSCTSAGSNIKTFTITIKPTPIVNNVTDITVCSGGSVPAVAFSANTGGSETFNWTNDNVGVGLAGSGSGNISGYTAPVNLSGAPIIANISVTATKNLCSGPAETFTITINPEPVVTAVVNGSFCTGDAINIPLTSNVVGATITWTNSNTLIGLGASGGGDITYVAPANNTGADIVGTITVIATKNSCVSAGGNAKSFTITIKPTPVVNVVSNVTVCSGTSVPLITFGSNIVSAGVTFNWTNDNPAINLAASGTGDIASFTASSNTSSSSMVANITVTGTKNSCTGPVRSFTITVLPEPVGLPTSKTICSDEAVATNLSTLITGGAAASAYNITITNAAGLVASAGLPVNGNGFAATEIQNDKWTNNTGLSHDIIYSIVPVSATTPACQGDSFDLTVTINPEPVVTFVANQIFCPGEAISIPLTSNVAGATLNWTNSNPSIGLAFSGSGNIVYTAPANNTGANIVGTVTVTGTANGCTSAGSNIKTFTITIRPTPIVNTVSNVTVCSGGAIAGIPFSANTGGGEVFNWTNDNTSIGLPASSSGNIVGYTAPVNISGSPIVANISVIATRSTCIGPAMVFTITVNPEPVVAVIASQSFCPGEPVAFTLTSNVAGASITWTNTNTAIGLAATGGGDISYTAPSNNTGADIIGTVTVTASKNGCTSAGANQKTFAITIKPTPIVNVVSNVTVCSGQPVAAINFASNIGSGGVTFNWTNDNTAINLGASGAGNIPGFTAATNTTSSPFIATISVVGTKNGCAGPARTFNITVLPQPVGIPTSVTVCSDAAVGVNLGSLLTGSAASYGITITNASGLPASGGSPGNGTGLSATEIQDDRWTNISGTQKTIIYSIVPLGAGSPGCTGASFDLTVFVDPEPVVAAIVDRQFCPASPQTIALTSNVAGATITWTNTNPLIGLGFTGSGDINYTTPANNTGADIVGTITVTAAKNGCISSGANIKTFNITIKPTPITNAVADVTVCSGGAIAAINFSANTGGSETFAWTNDNAAIGLATSGSGNIPGYSAPINLSGVPLVANLTVTATRLTCVGPTISFKITVNPEPVVAVIPNASYCAGEAVNIPLTSNVVGATLNWANTNTAIGILASGTGNIVYTAPTNNTGSDITGTITVTATANGCTSAGANIKTFVITIKPTPIVNAIADIVVCSGQNVVIPAFGSNVVLGGVTFDWTNDNIAINLGASGTGNIPSFTAATNISGLPIVANMSVVGTKNTCSGPARTFTITINPEPVVAAVINQSFCPGQAINIPLTSNVAGAAISWTNSNTNIGIASTGGGDIVYTAPVNNTGSDFVGTIVVTASKNSCISLGANSKTFTITIKATPVVNSVTPIVVCSGDPVTLITFTSNADPGVTFNWTNDNTAINLAANGVGNIPAFTSAVNTTSTPMIAHITVTGTKNSCTGAVMSFTISINPQPVISLPAPGDICSTETTSIILGTNGVSVTAASYQINDIQYSSNGGPFSVTPPGGFTFPATNKAIGTSGGTTHIRDDSYTNISTLPVAVRYTVAATSPGTPSTPLGCLGAQVNITVTVLPQPDFTFGIPSPLCSDDNINLQLLQAGATPVVGSYQITDVTFDAGLVPNVINNGAGVYTAAGGNYTVVGKYTNPTSTLLTATYKVKPIAVAVGPKQCVGGEKTGVIQIRPSPQVLTNLDKAVCNDTQNNVIITTTSTSAPAASFQIIRDPLPAGLTPNVYTVGTVVVTGSSTNNIGPDRMINTTDNPIDVGYRIRANTDAVPALGCYGPEEIILVKVEPQFRVTLDATTNLAPLICSGAATNIVMSSPSNPSTGVVTFNFSGVSSVPGAVSGLTPGFGLNEGDVIGAAATFPQTLVNTSNNDVTVTYTVTPKAGSAGSSPGGCNGTASTTTVTVHPKPKVTVPIFKTICEGTAVAVTLNSPTVSTPAVAFNYIAGVDAPGASGDVTGFAASGSFANNSTIGDILANNTTSSRNVTYTLTPFFGTCVGDAVSTTVTVSPRPVLNPLADFEVCTGEVFNPVAVTFDTDPSTTLVTWTATPVSGITGAVNGSGDQFTQVLFNSANDKKTVTYTFTATNVENLPQCPGTTETLDITVYPIPTITGVPSSKDVCFGAAVSIPLASNKLNTVYDWIADNNNDDPALPEIPNGSASGASPAINQTFFNNGSELKSYAYTITPYVLVPSTGAHCTGSDKSLVVNVAPKLTATLANASGGNEIYLCTGSKDFLYFTFGGHPNFDYTYSEGSTVKTVTRKGFVDLLSVQPSTTTTYTLLSAKDAFGCQTSFNQAVTVFVDQPDANFTVVESPIQCGPFQYHFNYNKRGSVTYTWKWGDGTEETEFSTTNPPAVSTKQHLYTNLSPSTTARFRVTMETYLDTTKYIGGCLKRNTIDVRLHPQISAAVFPDKEVICSDEQVAFVNSSQGATIHKWYYRPQGSSAQLEVRTTSVPTNYKLPNHTTSNPLVLEVVYEANNSAGCKAAAVVTPITVYRGVEAHFTHTEPTLFVGGSSVATFTNNSSPVDASDFRYDWQFGLNANPQEPSGVGPYRVDYSTPGPKEIVLLATNILAEQNGLQCADEYRETMQIIVPPLIAEFVVIPKEACFPVDLTVTENKGTGDKFAWRVLDDGGTAATSNAVLPVFKIPTPGKYTVEMVTTNSFTGDQKTATQEVTIYDLPMASFDVRPTTVYVPDGEINTFNFSDGATGYQWDFGDGTLTDEKEPKHVYKVEGAYDITLIALNDHGNDVICYDTLVRKVTAKQGGVTRVPNAFTPNPNGSTAGSGTPGLPGSNSFNDVFLPQVKGAEEFNMQIFDRWGNLIFESNNANVGWDGYDKKGMLMPSGVYVFKLTLRLSDGQRTTQVGDITMIR